MLRDSLRSMQGNDEAHHANADRQAMFIWSTLHGMASITQANVMQHLSLASGGESDLRNDMMARIGLGLQWPDAVIPVTESSAKTSRPARKSRR
jgi:hypothetical protein